MRSAIVTFDYLFYKQILFYQRCVGLDNLCANYAPGGLAIFTITMTVVFVLCDVYTLAAYDPDTRLKCLTVFGLGLQGFAKYPVIIGSAAELRQIVQFLRTIYVRNSTDAVAEAILRRWALRMVNLQRIGIVLVMTAACVYLPANWLECWQTGHRVPVLNALVPGVRIEGPGHWGGYAGVYAFHVVLLFLGSFGTCSADMMLVLLVMHLAPLAEIFALRCAVIGELEGPDDGPAQHHQFARYWRNLLRMHVEFNDTLRRIAQVYGRVFLAEIHTDALSLCACCACAIRLDWIGVWPLALMFVSKLLAYCALGTIAQMSTDRVYAALVGSRWPRLASLRQRRDFGLALVAAQRPTVLMAGTVPLNLDTFVNTMKTVYSVGMLLIESMDN